MKSWLKRLPFDRRLALLDQTDRLLEASGALLARSVRSAASTPAEAEFRVFSQYGEDGIIQFLLKHVSVSQNTFIEIGVQDYRESNTRFLVINDGWRGSAIDANESHHEFIYGTPFGWRHSVDAITATVTQDNINDVIGSTDFSDGLGILSIDIDGNDYWVWKAIDTSEPSIVIVEYNSLFGPEAAVTIPYSPAFTREAGHWSGLYWGASIGALTFLARSRGYELVAGNSAGNNAFFVRKEQLGELQPLQPSEAWRPRQFRDSRDSAGNLDFESDSNRQLRTIGHLPLEDVLTGERVLAGGLIQDGS